MSNKREIFFKTILDHPTNPLLRVTFTAEEEDIDVDGQFELQSDIDAIKERLLNGDCAAYFCAKVTVTLIGTNLEASDHLGCCSYETFEQFIESNDYYKDMINTATTELVDEINSTHNAIIEFKKVV